MSPSSVADSVAGESADELMRRCLDFKRRRRMALARLPYTEKLRILLRLQAMADAIAATRGVTPRAWNLDPETLQARPAHPGPRTADRPDSH
jgi:hypothetical protein